MLALNTFRSKAKGVADLLNWAALWDSGVVKTKSGALMAGYYYRGPDVASATASERNFITERVNAALARLGDGWVTWHDLSRHPVAAYPAPDESHFPDPITALIDAERRADFTAAAGHYVSEQAFILMYTPPVRQTNKLGDLMYDDDTDLSGSDSDTKLLAQFERSLSDLEDSLSGALQLRRMGPIRFEDGSKRVLEDELVNYLSYCLTGETDPVRIPAIPMYMDAYMGGYELWPGDTPKYGDRFITTVAIEGFPSDSWPNMLEVLNQLPIAYRWSTRMIYLDQHQALKELGRFRRKWRQKMRGFFAQVFRIENAQVNEDALLMAQQTDAAIQDAQSAVVTFGYYTSVVVMMDPDRQVLDEQSRLIVRELRRRGFAARVETVNTMEAWLGSLPGHAVPNVRRPPMHTLNQADLLPLASVYAGHPTNPCPLYPPHSPPLLHAATSGSTPFALNLHVGDVGNTLILGPIGAGKSTLLAMLAAQFRRYPDATVAGFDNGRSMFALCNAVGGEFYDVGSEDDNTGYAPLQFIDSAADRSWAEEWLATCYELQAGVAPSPHQKEAIHQAVTLMSNSAEGRSLTDFCATVQDEAIRSAITHYTISGPLGHLLDASKDGLRTSRFMIFEMSELMALGEKNLIPVLLYLFRRVDKISRGQPGLMPLDEAWVMLGHPVFRARLREWLKKKRKENWCIVPATQSLSDAASSGILDVLIESCPTKIFLPNKEANLKGTAENPGPSDLYKMFGLNEAEINIIRTATPKRHYYVVSPEGRRLIDLALGPVALSFVAVSDPATVQHVRGMITEHGEDWPLHWLAEREVSYEHLI